VVADDLKSALKKLMPMTAEERQALETIDYVRLLLGCWMLAVDAGC
jgi:hypothetical protein